MCQTQTDLPGPKLDPSNQPRETLGRSPLLAHAPRRVDKGEGAGDLSFLLFRDLFPMKGGRVGRMRRPIMGVFILLLDEHLMLSKIPIGPTTYNEH